MRSLVMLKSRLAGGYPPGYHNLDVNMFAGSIQPRKHGREGSGFRLLNQEDVTENMAQISKRRLESREKYSEELIKIEGEETFHGTQQFLSMVHTLANEKRLSRLAFACAKTRQVIEENPTDVFSVFTPR